MAAVLGIFRVIREEKLAFWIFVGVNLGFGGMAIWLPPIVATQDSSASPGHELLLALAQGNGYLFGLALLAAASSYWLRDYLDDKETEFRTLKTSATLFPIVLMIAMSLFLAIIVYRGFQSPLYPPGSPRTVLWGSLITQIILTIFALITATYLFCPRAFRRPPGVWKGSQRQGDQKNEKGNG